MQTGRSSDSFSACDLTSQNSDFIFCSKGEIRTNQHSATAKKTSSRFFSANQSEPLHATCSLAKPNPFKLGSEVTTAPVSRMMRCRV